MDYGSKNGLVWQRQDMHIGDGYRLCDVESCWLVV